MDRATTVNGWQICAVPAIIMTRVRIADMQGVAIKRFHAGGAANLIQDFSLIRMNLVADGHRI
jgi:hypothetical protein